MLRFGFTALLVFTAVACGRGLNQQGRPANLSIVASFPESASEVDDAPPMNSAFSLADISTSTDTKPVAKTTATTTQIRAERLGFLSRLNGTLDGAEKLFTHKRAFRWMSYRITNGSNVVKADSIPIDDPQLAELPPIEINAFIGDRLNVKMSFMQVDFQSEADAKDFCNNGSVGLIRAWSASAEPIVDDSGVVALEFSESGRSGVMMSVVSLSKRFDPGLMKTTLYNSFTDTKLNDDVCAVESVFPKYNSNQMFLKMMTFTHPLKEFTLVHSGEKQRWSVVSNEVTWKSLLANAREKDIGTDLGVASSFKADVVEGSLNLQPALYGDILPKELIPRLPLNLTQGSHATEQSVSAFHLRFDNTGFLNEKVAVDLVSMNSRDSVCEADISLLTKSDFVAEQIANESILLGQGAGTYFLRIRTKSPAGVVTCSTSPVQIDVPAFTVDAGENKIASGDGHTCAISGGRLSCWGNNSQGQVSGTSSKAEPILRPREVNSNWKAHAVFAGPNHTCAIIVDDKSASAEAVARCWGAGFSSNSEPELTNSPTLTIATSASHTCAVPSTSEVASYVSCVSHQGSTEVISISIPAKTDTSLFRIAISDDAACIFAPPSVEAAPVVTCYPLSSTAGLTSSGGVQAETSVSNMKTAASLIETSQLPVSDPATFQMVSDGSLFYAIIDGVLHSWTVSAAASIDSFTQLPDNVQKPDSIHAFGENVCVVRAGALLCWGANSGGQFGNNAGTQISVEEARTQRLQLTPRAVSLGTNHVCVTQGRQLRCWGKNDFGQLGISRVSEDAEDKVQQFTVVQ